jgi:CheY-like chemotaxis protein
VSTEAVEKGRILAIDDDQSIIDVLIDYFGESGYGVITAHHGGDGLMLAEQERPDVVLLDIRTAGLTGVEVQAVRPRAPAPLWKRRPHRRRPRQPQRLITPPCLSAAGGDADAARPCVPARAGRAPPAGSTHRCSSPAHRSARPCT